MNEGATSESGTQILGSNPTEREREKSVGSGLFGCGLWIVDLDRRYVGASVFYNLYPFHVCFFLTLYFFPINILNLNCKECFSSFFETPS